MQPNEYPHQTHEILNLSMGQGTGQKWFNSSTTRDTTHTYLALMIVNDTVFANLVDTYADVTDIAGNELSGITIPAGIVLYGSFTDVNLTSGIVCAIRER